MRVYLTGATGYVGRRVAEKLLQAGHDVLGLTRSETGARQLAALGANPVVGTLQDQALVANAAMKADGVIHTAFDHAGDWSAAVGVDRAFHELLTQTLSDSGKGLVTSNGTGIFGDTAGRVVDEDTPVSASPRVEVERIAIDAAERGVRSVVIRLPLIVYGHGGSVFIPTMIRAAQQNRTSYCIGDGSNLISTVHVDDAAELYVRALEVAQAGTYFHASSAVDVSLREIAQAIARMLNCSVKSISLEEAERVWHPTWARLLSLNNQTTSAKAIRELRWQPHAPVELLEDIEHGSYHVS